MNSMEKDYRSIENIPLVYDKCDFNVINITGKYVVLPNAMGESKFYILGEKTSDVINLEEFFPINVGELICEQWSLDILKKYGSIH